jgi:hypothetical protein
MKVAMSAAPLRVSITSLAASMVVVMRGGVRVRRRCAAVEGFLVGLLFVF